MTTLVKIKIEDDKVAELNRGLLELDRIMEKRLNVQDINMVTEHLAEANAFFHIQGRLEEIATLLYEKAKANSVYQVATNEETKRLSVTIQVKIAEGLHRDYTAMYMKTMRVIKSFSRYVMATQSILSTNKEVYKVESYNRNT